VDEEFVACAFVPEFLVLGLVLGVFSFELGDTGE
jgi:hypothetical protein